MTKIHANLTKIKGKQGKSDNFDRFSLFYQYEAWQGMPMAMTRSRMESSSSWVAFSSP